MVLRLTQITTFENWSYFQAEMSSKRTTKRLSIKEKEKTKATKAQNFVSSFVFVLSLYVIATTAPLAYILIKNRHGVESCHSKITTIVVNKMGNRRQAVGSKHTLDLRPNSKVIVVVCLIAVCRLAHRQHCRSDRATIVGSYTTSPLSQWKW